MGLLPLSEAQDRLLARAAAISAVETVALGDADGRVLAGDLAARLTQPPFDSSAMDGYALRQEDAASPMRLIGISSAGHAFERTLGPGQAVRIFTGAPVPAGADSVLLQEDAERPADDVLTTSYPVRKGQHVRPRGQDFTEAEIVLPAGTVMDFARLTVAAAMNHATLDVLRRPLVALLATGDELVAPGSDPAPAQIVASSTFGISAMARAAGADVLDLGIVADDRALIAASVERARLAGADVIVTLGGASVGDHDLVQATLLSIGMQLDFWRIAMRPGKPLMVGSLGDIHVIGLPGNPVSSMVCGLLFLEPLIRRLAGLPPVDRSATAIASVPLVANDQRQDYIRARLVRAREGHLLATPFTRQDSSMMKVFAQSDCLIVRPPHAPAVPAGSPCPVMLLRPPGI